MRRRLISLLVLMVASTGIALVGTVQAANAGTCGGNYSLFTSMEFVKNWTSPTYSRLHFYVWRDYDAGCTALAEDHSYRAGSGDGTTDECVKDHGWLPNGTYNVEQWDNWPGTSVRGIAFPINNAVCHDRDGNPGNSRTALFIHSKWPWPGDSGYTSAGCIKLNNTDIQDLRNQWRRFYGEKQIVYGQLWVH
jgi:hypothetical protein